MPFNSRYNELYKKAVDEYTRTGKISLEKLQKLQAALDDDTDAQNDNTDQQDKLKDKSVNYTKSLINLSKEIGSNLQAIRKNRESFTGLRGTVKTGIRIAGTAASGTAKTIGAVAGTIGDVALSAKHPAALIAGGIAKGVEWFADKSAKATEMAAKIAPVFADFALKELQDVVDAYQKLGSVGMTGAEGMTGMREAANRAGLSLKTYSAIVARNSQALAAVGGSTESGAQLLDKVSQATESVKLEYLRLGFSFEEQEELAIKGLDYRRRMGMSKTNDIKALGESTKKYYDLVDDISRMTGMKRSQAAAILEKQQSNIRFALMQQAMTERYSGDTTVADTMSSVSAALSVHGGEALAKSFQDATAGAGPKAAQEFEMLTGGQGLAIIEAMKNKEISKEETLRRIHQAVKEASKSRGGISYSATVGNMAVVSDESLLAADRFGKTTDLAVETMNETGKTQEEAKNATDDLTKNVTNAQVSLRDFAKGLDQLVAKEVLPRAASITNTFTDKLKQFVDMASKELGVKGSADLPKAPGTASPPAPKGPPEGQPQPGAAAGKPGEGLTGKPLSGVKPALSERISRVAQEYKAATGKDVNVTSAVRSPEEQQKLYADYLAGKSKYPVAPPGRSKHDRGLAIDVDSSIANQLDSMGLLAKYGLGRPVRNDPVHIEVVSAATGGAFSGPKSGYPAVLHGSEAVVPLPNGQDIPVEGGMVSDKFKEQLKLFDEQGRMIELMIAAVRNNNDANARILAVKSS